MLKDAKAEKNIESSSEPWPVKDGLIAIPFLASALALTWEVGFFLRIKGGAFGMFSVSEHVTFALQALPLAFFAASVLIGAALQNDLMDRHLKPRIESLSKPDRKKLANGILLVGMVASIAANIYQFYYPFEATLLALTVFGQGFFTAIYLAPDLMLRSAILGFVGLIGVFTLTFAAGVDSARSEISSLRPLNKIIVIEKGQDIKLDLNVRIMRTGERGVLYFDPVAQQFALIPWESIKRIDWLISSIKMR